MELFDVRRPLQTDSKVANKVAAFLQENDLSAFEDGKHEIDGDRFFVVVFEFDSDTPDKRIWETHRDHIDVHVVLRGEEYICHAFEGDCEQGEYHADTDYQEINNAPDTAKILMKPGLMIVLYPDDAHQTGVNVGETSQKIRKAVFKIKL